MTPRFAVRTVLAAGIAAATLLAAAPAPRHSAIIVPTNTGLGAATQVGIIVPTNTGLGASKVAIIVPTNTGLGATQVAIIVPTNTGLSATRITA